MENQENLWLFPKSERKNYDTNRAWDISLLTAIKSNVAVGLGVVGKTKPFAMFRYDESAASNEVITSNSL